VQSGVLYSKGTVEPRPSVFPARHSHHHRRSHAGQQTTSSLRQVIWAAAYGGPCSPRYIYPHRMCGGDNASSATATATVPLARWMIPLTVACNRVVTSRPLPLFSLPRGAKGGISVRFAQPPPFYACGGDTMVESFSQNRCPDKLGTVLYFTDCTVRSAGCQVPSTLGLLGTGQPCRESRETGLSTPCHGNVSYEHGRKQRSHDPVRCTVPPLLLSSGGWFRG
jgi:hypothetical protein